MMRIGDSVLVISRYSVLRLNPCLEVEYWRSQVYPSALAGKCLLNWGRKQTGMIDENSFLPHSLISSSCLHREIMKKCTCLRCSSVIISDEPISSGRGRSGVSGNGLSLLGTTYEMKIFSSVSNRSNSNIKYIFMFRIARIQITRT